MSQTDDTEVIAELHARAVATLRQKVHKTPSRAFMDLRKPNIVDFYNGEPDDGGPLTNKAVLPQYQIYDIFRDYNIFAATKFNARKKDQDLDVTITIWLWQMDDRHSLTSEHPQIRFNLLLAIITLSGPDAASRMDTELHTFLTLFLDAYVAASMRRPLVHSANYPDDRIKFIEFWKASRYDLISWNGRDRSRIAQALRELAAKLPPLPFHSADFWIFAKSQPKEEFAKHGRAWALQHLLFEEFWEKYSKDRSKICADHAHRETGGWETQLDSMGLSDVAPSWLTMDHFKKPAVEGLMVPIMDVEVSKGEWSEYWLAPDIGLRLLQGEVFDTDSVMARLEDMSLVEKSQGS